MEDSDAVAKRLGVRKNLPDGGADLHSYEGIFGPFYQGAFDAGLQVRILHAGRVTAGDAETFARDRCGAVVSRPRSEAESAGDSDGLCPHAVHESLTRA